MNDNIFSSQLVAGLQSQYKRQTTITFLPLIQLSHNKLTINPKGLRIIQSHISTKLYLIALYSKKHHIINNIFHFCKTIDINNNKQHSGIWISNVSRWDQKNKSQYLYLQAYSLNHQDQIKIHMILSLLCWAIVIDNDQYQKIKVLSSVNGRIVYDSKQQNSSKQLKNRKNFLSNIAILHHQDMNSSVVNSNMKRTNQQLRKFIKDRHLDERILDVHNQIRLLTVSQQKLINKNQTQSKYLIQNIQSLCFSCNKHQDFHQGPILSGYLNQVIYSINNKSIVDIIQCLNRIEIPRGYDAYQKSIHYYNNQISSKLNDNGMNNINPVLRHIRQQSLDQFHRSSNDALYLSKLTQYISTTQDHLKAQNNKILQLKNINYLQRSSDNLFHKIQRQNLSRQQIQRQLQDIKQDYKLNAYGDNKYQLLSNYIHTIHSTLGRGNNNYDQIMKKNQRELDNALRDKRNNQERVYKLEKQVKALEEARNNQRQSSKCCQIM